jgi:hypothetical protein
MSRQVVALSPGVSMDASLADTLPAPAPPMCIVGDCRHTAEEISGLVDYCAEHASEWLAAENGAA